MNNNVSKGTIDHEYGHFVQEKFMTTPSYLFYVGLPSVINCKWGRYRKEESPSREKTYYSKIWERTADWLGGVNRNNYDPIWDIDSFLCW